MKILVYAPIPHDATSFYRAFGPFNHLSRMDPSIEILNGSENGFEYNWYTLQNVDCVFVQRPSTDMTLDIIRVAKRCKKFVWIDYDDDYIKIPETNPRHDLYSSDVRQAIVRECIRLSDLVSVSTEEIKKTLEELDEVPKIVVIPNATDETLFEISPFSNKLSTKTVLWRGGDTHGNDFSTYHDAIWSCFHKHKEYTWVFLGNEFNEFVEEAILHGQGHRVKIYEFTDLMTYFECLMQIRPEIMIVPLADNTFNRGKSNISWQEGTVAGAVVLASKLPEFQVAGPLCFDGAQQLMSAFDELVSGPELRDSMYLVSLKALPILDVVNKKRLEIVNSIVGKKFTVGEVTPEQWNDKRFFEYALVSGYTQENPGYAKGHHAVADWLIERLKPETMIEFGCGPGPMLERFLMNNVLSIGLETNEYFIEYFQERNPVFADQIKQINIVDITDPEKVTLDRYDLGISIEVFEHIDMPEEWWDKFILELSKKIKFFYFTSTPYQSTPKFDLQWGHVNVRHSRGWINLFERNGWKFVENPNKIIKWDMLFESVYEEKVQPTLVKQFGDEDSKKIIIKG